MQVKLAQLFLLLLPFFILSSAITIPKGQPEGLYIVTIDKLGNEIHALLNSTATSNLTDSLQKKNNQYDPLYKRVVWPSGTTIVCQQDYLWSNNFYQTDGSYDKFFNACYNTYRVTSKALYEYKGQSVAYLCNYETGPGHTSLCRTEEWTQFVAQAGGFCTQGTGGWKEAGML